MKRIAIERKSGLSREAFARDHLQGAGMPVVLTDGMASWPALSKWTFDYLKSTYGADFSSAPTGLLGDVARAMTVGGYIDHLETGAPLPGFWVNQSDGRPLADQSAATASPAYLLNWRAFHRHPELFSDIGPLPSYVEDWTAAIGAVTQTRLEEMGGRELWSLYVGPKDSLSELHVDFWHSHGCLAMVRGTKRATLFSPEDSERVYGGKIDPERPDLVQFPLYDGATAYECDIGPGEMLFMPGDWWHHVRGLTNSITISHNFFNAANFDRWLASLIKRRAAASP